MDSIFINSKEPAFQQTADMIKGMIAAKNWTAGHRLPPYRKLAEILQVSYVTVKKAMDQLEAEGIIQRHQGRGCHVNRDLTDEVTSQIPAMPPEDEGSEGLRKVIVPKNLVRGLGEDWQSSVQGGALPIRFLAFTGLSHVINDSMGSQLMEGLEQRCAHNLQPLLFHCAQVNQKLHQLPDSILSQRVMGTVCFRPFNDSYLMALSRRCSRVVCVDRDATPFGMPSIVTDNESGALLATSRLLAAGHRKIAYLGSELTAPAPAGVDPAVAERFKGFRMAHLALGIDMNTELCLPMPNLNPASYSRAASDLVDSRKDFSALLAYDDNIAAEAIRSLKKAGLRVPEDCSVVSAGGIGAGDTIAGSYFEFSSLSDEVCRLFETFDRGNNAERVDIQPIFRAGRTFSRVVSSP